MQFSPPEITRKTFVMPFHGRFFVLITTIAVVATGLAATSNPNSQPQGQQAQSHALVNSSVNRVPDANDQMAMRGQESKAVAPGDANTERKRQIADDSAKLLKLAGDLKAEVDKSSQDTLSVRVIRKADEIEKLAHSVRDKMKVTMGGN